MFPSRNLMQRARLAALVPGTDLYHVFASPFHDGGSFHLRASTFATRLEGWYREYRMVGTSTTIYGREESLPIQAFCTTHRARPTRAHWRENRSVAHIAESFFGGVPAIGASPRRHCAVHFYATAHQSPCRHFGMGERLRAE